jgi:hypothetical protein
VCSAADRDGRGQKTLDGIGVGALPAGAGAAVGSDLIVVQKDTRKAELSKDEQNFVNLTQTKAGVGINKYIYSSANLIYTEAKHGTDLYGKSAVILTHSGGASGVADAIRQNLSRDFAKNFKFDLYRRNAPAVQVAAAPQPQRSAQEPSKPERSSEPLVTLYDLFGLSPKEHSQASVTSRKKTRPTATQQQLFTPVTLPPLPPTPLPPTPQPPTPQPPTPLPYTGATAEDALLASLDRYGEVRLDFIGNELNADEDEILRQLEGKIFYNPLCRTKYETAEKFLSGNVVEKSKALSSLSQKDKDKDKDKDKQLIKSIAALRNATPKKVPFELLEFNFGERWLPVRIYADFASDLFKSATDIRYYASADEFTVSAEGYSAEKSMKYELNSPHG